MTRSRSAATKHGRTEAPGLLLVEDSTVSFRHCVLTQHPGGRCTVRDLSRNGTRVDGRRLVPNVKSDLAPGQSLEVAAGLVFVLTGGRVPAAAEGPPRGAPSWRLDSRLPPCLSGTSATTP